MAATTAQQAIERSISHAEIVHLDFDIALADELSLESDDSARNGNTFEYWGTTDAGIEWRVRLIARAVPCP